MPVLVRSLIDGPTVFGDLKSRDGVVWQDRGDVQFVPDDLVMSSQFLRAIHQGQYEVIDPTDEMRDMLDKQAAYIKAPSPDTSAVTSEDRKLVANMQFKDGRIVGIARPTEKLDDSGKPIEVTIPVIIDPNTSKVFNQPQP